MPNFVVILAKFGNIIFLDISCPRALGYLSPSLIVSSKSSLVPINSISIFLHNFLNIAVGASTAFNTFLLSSSNESYQ